MEFHYFHIKVEPAQLTGGTLHALGEHGEIYLGCHTRLAGPGKAATFISEDLANEFLAATLPTLCKRHGEGTEASVVKGTFNEWSETDPRVVKLYQIAAKDSKIVKTRIEASDFRPNAFGADGRLKTRKRRS